MEWRLFATMAEAAGAETVSVDPGPEPTVGDALDALVAAAPAIEERLYDGDGEIYGHVRILHEGEDPFAGGDGLAEPVAADDELALMPAVSGG